MSELERGGPWFRAREIAAAVLTLQLTEGDDAWSAQVDIIDDAARDGVAIDMVVVKIAELAATALSLLVNEDEMGRDLSYWLPRVISSET